MTNKEIREEFIRVLNSPKEELSITHPTVCDHNVKFVDYTEDGYLTLEFPIRQDQCNGYKILQGGAIASFMDDNYGLFTFISMNGSPVSTIDMTMNFHKAVTLDQGFIRVTSHVRSAGKRVISLTAKAFNPDGVLIASSSTNFINAAGAFVYV